MKIDLTRFKKYDWALVGIIFVSLLFRLYELDLRPPHFDEGIVGFWVDQIIATGFYPYDPLNYHGPLPYYFEFFSKILFGRNIWALRIPSVIMGAGGVYIITLFKDFIGKPAAYGTALLLAVSPAAVYYTRFTPIEIGLFFFSLLTCYGYVRWVEKRDVRSLWCMGIGISGMATTKETFVINFVCFLLAMGCLKVYETLFKVKIVSSKKGPKNVQVSKAYTDDDVTNVLLGSALFFVIFYSGFFTHWNGPGDFFRCFGTWFKTGTAGSGHDKPFWYWIQDFERYEWATVVGLVLCTQFLLPYLASPGRRTHWMRLFGIYGTGNLLAYSIIPYKTPWCIIQLLWPFLFVFAGTLVDIYERKPWLKKILVVVFAGLVFVDGAFAIRLNLFHNTDDTEPYVYVQSYQEIVNIDQKLKALVKKDINNYHMPIKIYMEDTWPIPWMWAEFTHIGWMGNGGFESPDAPLVLADINKRSSVEGHFKNSYFFKVFRLRAAQGESVVYYDTEKFKDYFGPNADVFHPVPSSPGVQP